TGNMDVTDASVDVGNCHYAPWPDLNVSVPPGKDLILTQTGGRPPADCANLAGNYNFDTSESNNTSNPCVDDGLFPEIRITVNGRTLTYDDSGRILNTGGLDSGATRCGSHNETHQWESTVFVVGR
ncbi:MAG: hypothetical protein J2P28_11405, partial [Actinobacteria bacterium]|nr:hypothetical protein [Actinomycetota bacterium]